MILPNQRFGKYCSLGVNNAQKYATSGVLKSCRVNYILNMSLSDIISRD